MAILIDQSGKITAGIPPAAPEWEDRYQATMWVTPAVLTRLLGTPEPFGGWLAYTPAGIALIGPAHDAPGAGAWDVIGAEGALGPVARAIWKALGRAGTRPRCGCPVNARGLPHGTPSVPCGRPMLHPGPHRSPQALRRYSQRAAVLLRRTAGPARDAARISAPSFRGGPR